MKHNLEQWQGVPRYHCTPRDSEKQTGVRVTPLLPPGARKFAHLSWKHQK